MPHQAEMEDGGRVGEPLQKYERTRRRKSKAREEMIGAMGGGEPC